MTRSGAVAKLKSRYLRRELTRAGAIRVICDDPVRHYDEHPDAYSRATTS